MSKKEKEPLLAIYCDDDTFEASLDEAGLGCLAGPVVAAAVVWPHPSTFDDEHQKDLIWINDSKKLSAKRRVMMKKFIETYALDYSVKFVDVPTIDKINIYQARFKAMHDAISDLKVPVSRLVVDGDKFIKYVDPNTNKVVPHECVVGGDAKYQGIAAASILAKVTRDAYMDVIDLQTDGKYGWKSNKGYGTKAHYDALKKYGPTEHHRKSFNLHLSDENGENGGNGGDEDNKDIITQMEEINNEYENEY